MKILIAVAKTNKFSSAESGDTLEVIERPAGGVSVVLADGQTFGHSSKAISSLVAHKVIQKLAQGERDWSAAKQAAEHLYSEHNGNFTAYLNILSVDLITSTLLITRNNPTPIIISHEGRVDSLLGESSPIGSTRDVQPVISEIPLETGTTVVMFTDGLMYAGKQTQQVFDVRTYLEFLLEEQEISPERIADSLLSEAIRLDHGSVRDDMSVVVLQIRHQERNSIRRMSVTLPINIAYKSD
jgi:serine phosphatase RsbU (regulator of sigma subunit)